MIPLMERGISRTYGAPAGEAFVPIVARDGRRLAILHAALDVFIRDGFAAASMSSIADRLGGSKSTLYNYFPSKEALFAAVVLHECEQRIGVMFQAGCDEGESVEVALRGFAKRYIRLVLCEETMRFTRMLIAEASRQPELGALFYEAGPRQSRLRLASYIEGLMVRGQMSHHCALDVAQQFFDLCLGDLYLKRLMNIVPPLDDGYVTGNAEAAVSLILARYGPILLSKA